MRNAASYLLAISIIVQTCNSSLYGEPNDFNPSSQSSNVMVSETQLKSTPEPTKPVPPFIAFTGRTIKNKVRIRLQPSLDAPILREINKGDLFVVVGETEDFFAIEAPEDIKGYVFRTYVLDNVIEGNRVNVRLEPNLESPIIAQLSSGDKVNGQISALNSKWIEMTPPSSTRFYIAKEYVEKIGNSSLKVALDQKRVKGIELLNNTLSSSQAEMQKPWNQINLDNINGHLNNLIKDYSEFPDLQAKAKEAHTMIQESYFQKKIAYLETVSKNSEMVNAQNKELSSKLAAQEQRLQELGQNNSPSNVKEDMPSPPSYETKNESAVDKMNFWLPLENQRYESWAETHENQPISAFYDEQMQNASTLKGIIQQYDRTIKNKPGDYVLLNPNTRIPTAYLYSSLVNLQEYVGKEVTLKASPRDNNNFAYPAYFVLSIE